MTYDYSIGEGPQPNAPLPWFESNIRLVTEAGGGWGPRLCGRVALCVWSNSSDKLRGTWSLNISVNTLDLVGLVGVEGAVLQEDAHHPPYLRFKTTHSKSHSAPPLRPCYLLHCPSAAPLLCPPAPPPHRPGSGQRTGGASAPPPRRSWASTFMGTTTACATRWAQQGGGEGLGRWGARWAVRGSIGAESAQNKGAIQS